MAKVRIIGTYQPERTALHGVDARAKIAFLLLMTIASFVAHSARSFFLCGALFAAALLLARIKPLQLVAALKPAGIILVLSMAANAIVPAGSAFVALGPLGLSAAGLVRGVVAVLRIALLVGFALVIAATTTQTQIVDAFMALLAPLGPLGVPVGEIAMALSLALRFIPIAVEEFARITAAQAARGANLSSKGPLARIAQARSVVVPLVVRLFSYAEGVAHAMTRQGYDGSLVGEGVRRLRVADRLIIAAGIAAVIATVIL